jgi:uncharacterized glyoxalase superfamily protein PhnB
VQVVDWPGPEGPAALVRAGFHVVSGKHPPAPPGQPAYQSYEVRPGEPAGIEPHLLLDGGGHLAFRDLVELPRIDLVSTYRPAEEQPAIVQEAIARGAQGVWVEPGETTSDEARRAAGAAGLAWVEGVPIRSIVAFLGRTTRRTSPVTASVSYHDAPSAIDWLVASLGFRVLERHDLPDGGIAHARLAWGDGMIFVSTRAADGPWSITGPASIALNQADAAAVDALHQRTFATGAEIIEQLHDAPYGSHQFSVRDPEGNAWTVGTYLPVVTA